ncbi:MAG: hypothetical protein JSS57_00560 [Proteobacteria bacterium]|nr:hypothetical protein [Pseudomonadota bacterium]
MPISEVMEQKMVEANRARNAQDKRHPMLININDGRLIPNVPKLRTHKDYRVYMGDPKAPLEDRLRVLQTQGMLHGAAVVDTGNPSQYLQMGNAEPLAGGEAFDISKATREQLKAFAVENYGVSLDEKGDTHLMTLRAQVRDLAKAKGDLA